MKRMQWSFWGVLGATSLAGWLIGPGASGAQKSTIKFAGKGEAGPELLEPVTYENLTLFPVIARGTADTSGFATLDEALESGDAVVTETASDTLRRSRDGFPHDFNLDTEAQVNRLVLINRGKRPLLLLAGELVSGGKQDRIISKDRIVAPGSDPLPLDVFCVEQGRWSSGTQFSSAKVMVHPSVREKAAVDQQQTEVWNAVRSGSTSNEARAASPSSPPPLSANALGGVIGRSAPTQSYKGIYESPTVGRAVEPFAQEIARRFAAATEGKGDVQVVGVVVAYGGEVAWSDIFASPALFTRYWPKLLRSYVVEALARPGSAERASSEDAARFLQPLKGTERVESEQDLYRWREITAGSYAEITLTALRPSEIELHRLRVLRTN